MSTTDFELPSMSAIDETFELQFSSENATATRTSNIAFTGKAGEYFGIWIVNVLLTILTLGIYSAWAKVRTQQYFLGHTKVDGHAFRYLATPGQILKSRILALAVISAISVLSHFFIEVTLFAMVAAIFIVPLLLIQALKFNLRMTSYRNVRFGFHGRYIEAFINFIVMPLLSLLTFGWLMPYMKKRIDKFIYENISYGGQRPIVNNRGWYYYLAAFRLYLVTIAWTIFSVAFVIAIAATTSSLNGINFDDLSSSAFNELPTESIIMTLVIPSIFVGLLAISFLEAFSKKLIRNHLFDSAQFVGLASFKSNVDTFDLGTVIFGNYLINLCSLGFGYPITKIRSAAYFARVTEVTIYAEVDLYIDQLNQNSSAFLEEAADLYDVEFSLT